MQEFKQIASPISITTKTAKTGEFFVFNKQFFSDLSDFGIFWSITRDGLETKSGKVALPQIGPRRGLPLLLKSGGANLLCHRVNA